MQSHRRHALLVRDECTNPDLGLDWGISVSSGRGIFITGPQLLRGKSLGIDLLPFLNAWNFLEVLKFWEQPDSTPAFFESELCITACIGFTTRLLRSVGPKSSQLLAASGE